MSSIGLSLIAFAAMLAGAFFGAFLRRTLPDRHLADESKDVVRLGSGLIGTIAALVLGLLIASAKGSYDSQVVEVRQMTAHVALLDRLLALYGPETRSARDHLRTAVGALADRIWTENSSEATKKAPFEVTTASEAVFIDVRSLMPQNNAQISLKARAMQTINDLVQTRLLLQQQAGSSLPMPFLVVLILWLTIIFVSFSLFSRLNPILVAALFVFALSASAAIFLVLDLSKPFAATGLMRISSEPLRNALAPLAP